jgi:hypothetical protein
MVMAVGLNLEGEYALLGMKMELNPLEILLRVALNWV